MPSVIIKTEGKHSMEKNKTKGKNREKRLKKSEIDGYSHRISAAFIWIGLRLAEIQSALPGEIKTDKPLKLVLDRRPFI